MTAREQTDRENRAFYSGFVAGLLMGLVAGGIIAFHLVWSTVSSVT
jgi:hypothetical protein